MDAKTNAQTPLTKMPSTDDGEVWGKNKHVSPEERKRMIAEVAYYYAEHRHFVGGDPAQDWLRAETEVDRILKNGHSGG